MHQEDGWVTSLSRAGSSGANPKGREREREVESRLNAAAAAAATVCL